MKDDSFALYKPLRNYLGKQNLNGSLLAIHAHMEFQQSHKPLPSYVIGAPSGYRDISRFSDLLNFHIFPWELSQLCKEVILSSVGGTERSLLEWRCLAGAVNHLTEEIRRGNS